MEQMYRINRFSIRHIVSILKIEHLPALGPYIRVHVWVPTCIITVGCTHKPARNRYLQVHVLPILFFFQV